MRVAFLRSDKPREGLLADAFLAGAARHGHATEAIPLSAPITPGGHDVVCMVGVKSKQLFDVHRAAGSRVIYLDKGYCRHRAETHRGWEYWRVATDAHQPTRFLEREWPDDRWAALGLEFRPWREDGEHVLLAGSSAKYHAFYGLKDPTSWMKGLVKRLLRLTSRPLVYRPKPSWREAVPINRTTLSASEPIGDALAGAWVTVTHGSNACFESVLAGVPCIVLGEAVAKPLSATSVDDVEEPRLASDDERLRWARALAYHQFTAAEFADGKAWDVIKDELHA